MSAIQKATPPYRWLSNQTNSKDYPQCFLSNNSATAHGNGQSRTFDGYTFKTSSDFTSYLQWYKRDISSTELSNALEFGTKPGETIGSDRDLWLQYYNTTDGPLSRNVIGYTGLWYNDYTSHPARLDMVVFHYIDQYGNWKADYKVNNNLHSFSSSAYYWEYANTGSKQSGVDWHIAYAIDSNRRQTVCNNGWLLAGFSMQIRFRTPVGQGSVKSRYYHFSPIMGKKNSSSQGLTSINSTNAKNEEGQIIYQRANHGKNPDNDEFLFAY
jgi:hypothetical protein